MTTMGFIIPGKTAKRKPGTADFSLPMAGFPWRPQFPFR
jgi:hypothetical protein